MTIASAVVLQSTCGKGFCQLCLRIYCGICLNMTLPTDEILPIKGSLAFGVVRHATWITGHNGYPWPSALTNTFDLIITNPHHVIGTVLSRRAHRMSSQVGTMLQLWGEELEATGPCRYRLLRRWQARHDPLRPMWAMTFPSHVHGVALRPLLGRKGGSIAQAVMIRLVGGR
ncbi:hypothetical protein GOODEAATRI_013013 [Goodea atripinnis]|uniref:Endonuclease n=1 Tax=Goodea atripinnis TaxID=208336 RepID=A0ABV0MKA9_9TELE